MEYSPFETNIKLALIEADRIFSTGPVTDKTFYHRSLYSPINYEVKTFFPVYAGYTTDIIRKFGIYHDPMLVCMSPSAKLVENYMFGLRRYECIHTFYSERYGGDRYTYNGNSGAFAEIRYHLFDSEESYEEFLDENPLLRKFEFSSKKPKIDSNFWMPLPQNNKLRLPKIIEMLIAEDRRTLNRDLENGIRILKYLFCLSNFENETFDPKDYASGLKKSKNEIAASIFYAAEFMQDFHDYLAYRETSTPYNGYLSEETLNEMRKNTTNRSPVLFYSEDEYRTAIVSYFEARRMDLEYKKLIDYPGNLIKPV